MLTLTPYFLAFHFNQLSIPFTSSLHNLDHIHHLISPVLPLSWVSYSNHHLPSCSRQKSELSPLTPLSSTNAFNFSSNYCQCIYQICLLPSPGRHIFGLNRGDDLLIGILASTLATLNLFSILPPYSQGNLSEFQLNHVTSSKNPSEASLLTRSSLNSNLAWETKIIWS